jgi:hypothetical protein
MEEEIEKPVECPRNRMKRMRTILRQQLANKYFKSVRKKYQRLRGERVSHLPSLFSRWKGKKQTEVWNTEWRQHEKGRQLLGPTYQCQIKEKEPEGNQTDSKHSDGEI